MSCLYKDRNKHLVYTSLLVLFNKSQLFRRERGYAYARILSAKQVSIWCHHYNVFEIGHTTCRLRGYRSATEPPPRSYHLTSIYIILEQRMYNQ